MNRGQIIELEIEDMTVDGQGLGKTPEGLAVFVYGGLPGDTLSVELTKVKKRYAFAKLLDIVKASPHRTEGFCDFQDDCGGCMYSKITYDMQAKLKERHLKEALIRLAGLKNPDIKPIVKDSNPFRYRNKASMQVSRKLPELHVNANTAKGPGLKNSRKSAGKIKGGTVEPVIGFYRRNSHDIVDCHDCKIQSMPAVAVADALRRYMKMYEAPGCGKNAEKGLIRNVTVRIAFGTGEVMVILTLAGSGVPHAEELTEMLADAVDACNLKACGNSSATYGNSSATCDNSSATCGDFSATYGSASKRCENCSEPRANLPADDSFDTLLPAEPFYSLQSIVLNMDTDKTSRKGGAGYLRNVSKKNTREKRSKVLAGKSTINDELGGMRFEISPYSFYQINPVQTEKLYNTVCRYAELSGGEKILDLYCGAGTIGLWLLNELRSRDESAFEKTSVVGVEAVKSAVIDANRNAVINGIVNARYLCGMVEEEIPNLMSEDFTGDSSLKIDEAHLAILDPPRNGCDERLLSCLLKASPQKIIYVSCDPATMARDVKFLLRGGYEFIEATPVDMFGWTGHVESIVLLSKLDSRRHISVKFPIDEMDISCAESKATYEQIKNYVLEKYGFKVSTLYIAQVKRKYGLDVREHYNMSKNGKQKIAQCPIEKEEAILDALKYFKMIKDGF